MRCVGCDEEMENALNHHCDPIREAKIENARKSHDKQQHRQRRLTEGQRLSMGFEMMNLNEED